MRTEQIKLTATYLNGLAIALFAVGVLAPLFSTIYGTVPGGHGRTIALSVAICLLASMILHFIARRSLRGLSQ